MRRIRYIKTLLVIGVITALGLCALLLAVQGNQPQPSNGAKLIFKNLAGEMCL